MKYWKYELLDALDRLRERFDFEENGGDFVVGIAYLHDTLGRGLAIGLGRRSLYINLS